MKHFIVNNHIVYDLNVNVGCDLNSNLHCEKATKSEEKKNENS